jgi:sugar/nucleoside kinase (ribokinase family)
MVSCKDFLFCLPAYPVETVVDPTGAGDTFAGGFMGYLASRRKIDAMGVKKAITFGTVIASFNVEGFGLERSCRVTKNDLQRRYRHLKTIASVC